MARIFAITGITVALLAPTALLATAPSTDGSLRSLCIATLRLTAKQAVATGFQYRIERCVEMTKRLEGSQEHLKRLKDRNEKILDRIRGGSGIVVPLNRYERTNLINKDQAARQGKPSVRQLRRTLQEQDVDFRLERDKRALLRRARIDKARELCEDVMVGFIDDCVREELLRLGTMSLEQVQKLK